MRQTIFLLPMSFKYKSLNSGGREIYMSEYKSDHKAKNTPIMTHIYICIFLNIGPL